MRNGSGRIVFVVWAPAPIDNINPLLSGRGSFHAGKCNFLHSFGFFFVMKKIGYDPLHTLTEQNSYIINILIFRE